MLKLSEKLEDKGILCNLCPNYCILENVGQKGRCLVRESNGEEIFLNNYGQISSMAIEPIEKKPITEFLKGSKTLSIGFEGCPLSCNFCENYKISQQQLNNNKYYSISEIIILAKKYNCESICMTYNEPTISYEFLIDLANETHNNDLYFVLKTNGYINKEPWGEICEITDAMNIDLKGSDEKYLNIIGAKEPVVRDRIKEAYNYEAHIEISIPLFYEDIEYEINDIGKFLSKLDKNIPCHLLKIYSSYKHNKNTTNKEIKEAENILREYMNNVSCY